jgi:fatty-acyl-CoA synthase
MMMLPKADIMRKAGSIGLPGFFTEIWIEDSNGRRLPPGEIGEIVATGPTVMTGYWNNPEKTRETIVNGVLHTGDLGYTDKDGYFYIVDRAKDMYRSGGENVYPAEIEKVLCEHPKIENVSIIGVPDDRWGETGKAFVVCKKGDTITKDEIYSYLDGKVARYKFPTHIVLVDSLPMTSSGKIRKSALKEAEATVFD